MTPRELHARACPAHAFGFSYPGYGGVYPAYGYGDYSQSGYRAARGLRPSRPPLALRREPEKSRTRAGVAIALTALYLMRFKRACNAWIILGLIAGFIASKIVDKRGQGLLDIALGIVGALVGGFLFDRFGASGVTALNIYSMIVAIVGSVVVLVIYNALATRLPRLIRHPQTTISERNKSNVEIGRYSPNLGTSKRHYRRLWRSEMIMIAAGAAGLVVIVLLGWLALDLSGYGVLVRDGQEKSAAGVVSRQCTYPHSRGLHKITPAYDRPCLKILRFG